MTALLYFIPNSPRGYKEIQKEDTRAQAEIPVHMLN